MNAGFAWMLAGLVLCGAEVIAPGVFLLWIGAAALVAGLVIGAARLGFPAQIATFLVLLAALLAIPLSRRRVAAGPPGGVNAPDSDLVGKTCRALAFAGAEGRVSFRDGTWSARMVDGQAPAPGTALRVVGLEGTVLVVRVD